MVPIKEAKMKSIKPIIPINMRMPQHLVAWVEDRAQKNMRSRHAELLFILEMARKKDEKE